MPDYVNSKRVVAVTSRSGSDQWIAENTANYIRVLEQQGVRWVILAPDTPARLTDGSEWHPENDGSMDDGVLQALDGVILSGGGDVDPMHFGQKLDGAETDRIDAKRDALELRLTRAAFKAGVPIFGICRGCQVLNVAAGGELVQHFDGHRSPETGTAFHQVRVAPGTRLHESAGVTELTVNTFHHQGINVGGVAPGFVASGIADPDSWLVEAIESTNHGWALGVQWHPERVFELDEAHARIWGSFLAACAARQASRVS